MPALPWTDCQYRPHEGESLHVLTSTLPLQSYRDVPRFLRWTSRIRKQVAFVESTATPADLPLDWGAAKQRLEDARTRSQ